MDLGWSILRSGQVLPEWTGSSFQLAEGAKKEGTTSLDRINEIDRMIEDFKEWADWGVGRIQFSVGSGPASPEWAGSCGGTSEN